MRVAIKIYYALFFALLVSSCAHHPAGVEQEIKITKCESPRPQICTREYKPVCGFLLDGDHKVYATACVACSNENVSGYVEGECK